MTAPASPIVTATARRIVEDALQLWLAAGTGVGEDRCFWQDAEVVRESFPFASLAWLSTVSEGQDANVVEDLGVPQVGVPDIRIWSTGQRRCVISVQLFSDPRGAPESSALARLETALARLGLPTVRSSLNVAGFGFVSSTGARRVAPGQYSAEVTGYVAAGVFEDTTSIQTVVMIPKPELDFVETFTAPIAGASVAGATYVGSSASIVTEANVLAQLAPVIVAGFPHTFNVDGAAGQHVWFAVPSSFGVDTFIADGWEGGFVSVGTLVVNGVTCDLWRSFATGLGAFAVELSKS